MLQAWKICLQKAAYDKAHRPLFYKALLESELFVLTSKPTETKKGKSVHDKQGVLQVRTFKNGKVPLFTSEQRIFDGSGIITLPVDYVLKKARVIF
jgi:hypothetical protein